MIAASQDIDYFIERQRSKLNKVPNRQQGNRQQGNRQRPAAPPPPPPPPQSFPSTNFEDRLDVKVNRILDEPSPRIQSQQPYYPPSPRPIISSPFSEQQTVPFGFEQEQLRLSNDSGNNNEFGFFDRFGNHDEQRAQLKDDLKREYNDFLRTQRSVSKNKSTSQIDSSRGNTTRRVQFQQDGIVVAPWEKTDKKTTKNLSNTNDIFSSSASTATTEYTTNRARSRLSQNHDEQYIRDREEYILELYEQIRELEARKRQLELVLLIESTKLSTGNSSSVTRAHYAEDLTALNTLLAERLNQRNAIDLELARILNRPPVATSSAPIITGGGVPALNMSFEQSNQQNNDNRYRQQYRNDSRSKRNNDNGFQIGNETDKEAEQAAKKRYQQELQAQMREKQMRKSQAKQEKDEYERKLESEINRYNYFGRSGGGAPMRDKDGNVIANLGDLRNPQQQQQQYQTPRSQQPYTAIDDKVYSLGVGASSITNAPFYNGEPQNLLNSDRSGSPNHARGAVSNGIFGTIKTEEQIMREEKYKQDLKKQIDEKRQRNAEELARRRAEEERELAKHAEWQQQMDKQMADEAARKQEKEVQERQHQQRLQEELERQKKQEEIMIKRKPKRQEKPMSPNNDENDADRQNSYDEQQEEPVYRSSSPPVPTLKNKDKKRKSNNNTVRHQSFDDTNQQQLPPINDNDEFTQPPIDDNDEQGQQTYRKLPTPKQPDVPPARKKLPQTHRSRPQANFNTSVPLRTNSTASLRSDGSDSEVLHRLEHLKRQLKDKEARLHLHAKSEAALLSDIEEQTTVSYLPPSQPSLSRKQSPGYLLNTMQVPYRNAPSTHDKLLRVLQTDDDDEFKPSYFRDDSILMRGGGGGGITGGEYISPSKRVDLVDGMFVTDIEDAARRRRYGFDPPNFYDPSDPTSMASLELNRIAEKNEHRLKKLRDLEKDDTSLLDSNEVLERFQQRQRLQGRGSQTTLQDDAWLK
ncbi:unnamed protein product [Rotaria sp. Silwood2]|nr:unnamed protein product [Rotaria sp. Silwood2]CAF2759272.1 unnamed protein product [Rotaria sp. Silwood2]CAF3169549.1 unnamed protein product [Rotaria sp. Silwood2]CAF3967234.1 unnamed protein product [Rotaria sp. Silwood2]CAF4087557.1 unnamed protein product [Rotaria sp. Silwood2]